MPFGPELVGAIVALAGAVIMATDKRVLRRLREQGANAREKALPASDFKSLSRWRLSRLQQKGMIQCLDDDAYFVDEEFFQVAREKRRKRAVVIISILASAGIVFLALWYLGF